MSLGDMWAAEVRVTVARDGSVRGFDRRYWCGELVRHIGREVFLRLPVEDAAPAQVWIGDHYVCSPDLIQMTGFLDHGAAIEVVAGYRARRAAHRQREDEARASVIRGQAEALLKLIDDRVGKARDFRRILGIVEIETLTRALKRLAGGARLFGFKAVENAEQEGVISPDPGLEQAEAILKHLDAVFGGSLHGGAPAADDAQSAAPPGDSQPISDAPKYGDAQ